MQPLLSRLKSRSFMRVILVILASNFVSVVLFLARAADAGNMRYWFLMWNLVLGWLPFIAAWVLTKRLRTSSWLSAVNLIITALWLGFLPNSFYLVSDLVHLSATGEVGLLYDIVMFMSFIFNSLVVGFMSMFFIHRELMERIKPKDAHLIMGTVILACSFAVYLGRYLRWNTWDLLVNPAGLLFDVSDRFVNPAAHPQALVTTITFFLLISSMYAVIWQLVTAVAPRNK